MPLPSPERVDDKLAKIYKFSKVLGEDIWMSSVHEVRDTRDMAYVSEDSVREFTHTLFH